MFRCHQKMRALWEIIAEFPESLTMRLVYFSTDVPELSRECQSQNIARRPPVTLGLGL